MQTVVARFTPYLTLALALQAGLASAVPSRSPQPPLSHYISDFTRRDDPETSGYACGNLGGGQVAEALAQSPDVIRRSEVFLKARAEEFPPVTIPVAWHVIAANETAEGGWITDEKIVEQMQVINDAYAPVGISYNLINTTRTVNEAFFTPIDTEDEAAFNEHLKFKAALNSGHVGTLDIYSARIKIPVVGFVLSLGLWLDTTLNATKPAVIEATRGAIDGVVIDHLALPGGPLSGTNSGHTLTHEIGHWCGLIHTFGRGTGDCLGKGDYVADTPAQGAVTRATLDDMCPSADTCPDQEGLDPNHNYMNYVREECMTEFTPGQIALMRGVLDYARSI